MSSLINLENKRFGRLIVSKRMSNGSGGKSRWLCTCDCGGSKIISSDVLRRGISRSCGCIVKTHGMSYKKIYSVWANMKDRCTNKNNRKYPRYGGRGIVVCSRWQKFENFNQDMGSSYKDGLTIERINNEGNYEPSNCKWATYYEQNNNRNYGKHKISV